MRETIVNPTLGWSWTGLALGPIALIKFGLWRELRNSGAIVFTIVIAVGILSYLLQAPIAMQLVPVLLLISIAVLILLFIWHVLVATSLNRWRTHQYLRDRTIEHGEEVTKTIYSEDDLRSDLALLRYRAAAQIQSASETVKGRPHLSPRTPTSHETDVVDPANKKHMSNGSDSTESDLMFTEATMAPDSETVAAAPDHYFAVAMDELSHDRKDCQPVESLWQFARRTHTDNYNLARSLYIRLRVTQLIEAETNGHTRLTSAHNRKLADSRRKARLRAYESFIETTCMYSNSNSDSPGLSDVARREVTTEAVDLSAAAPMLHSVAEVNRLMDDAGITVTATATTGYLIQNHKADEMEIDDPVELEQFLQLLVEKMSKIRTEFGRTQS